MEEKILNKDEEIEIDLSRLLRILSKRSWLMATVSVICALAALLASFLLITPQYESSVLLYVNNNTLPDSAAPQIRSSDDIYASRSLVKTCILALETRLTLREVIDEAAAERTCEQLLKMIEAEAVDDTEVLRVSVRSPDPQEAERLANAVAVVLPRQISDLAPGTSIRVMDYAVVAAWPSSPDYIRNVLIGFGAGLVLSAASILLRGEVTPEEDENEEEN